MSAPAWPAAAAALLAPVIEPSTREFWRCVDAGRLSVQRCDSCGIRRFPPLEACPECASTLATWAEVGEPPTLYTWIVVRRATHPELPVPYAVGLVEYAPGLRVPGLLLIEDATRLRAGMTMALRPTRHRGWSGLGFVVAAPAAPSPG